MQILKKRIFFTNTIVCVSIIPPPPVCFCMDTDSLPFQSPALAQPKFHSQLGASRPLGRCMACTHTNQISNRQLLFQHQTTQIYNPVFFVLKRGLQKRPVIQRCKLFVSWKLIHNGEKLYARRDCCSTDQNFSQHLCIQTLAGFLLLVSSSWSASSLAITFSDFPNCSCASTPVGNLNLQT